MQIDEKGWLVAEDSDQIKQYPTVRTMRLVAPEPLGIVWHWTAGRGGPKFAENLARSIRYYKHGVDSPASWHICISKGGAIFQSAPFNIGTWHVGRPGIIAGQKFDNINRATIGIELENAGRLNQIGGRWYCWPYKGEQCIVENERAIVVHKEGYFDAFPPAQINAATKLLQVLVNKFGFKREVCAYGHVDFDPSRREDPGPLFRQTHLPKMLDEIFGVKKAPLTAQLKRLE